MQSLLRAVYPPQCAMCAARLDSDFGLCGTCWAATPFCHGLVCDLCGVPLPGHSDHAALCDDCLAIPRPWEQGRAAMVYRDGGRRLVLALKHGDRTDLARPAAGWMRSAGAAMLRPGAVLAPVPAHPWRLFQRRYNQAALLAAELSRLTGLGWLPDSLVRTRRTAPLDGFTRDQRFIALDGAIVAHPRRGARLKGRAVVLVDDVMTSGATLATAAAACHAAGASAVSVLVLARVAKDA